MNKHETRILDLETPSERLLREKAERFDEGIYETRITGGVSNGQNESRIMESPTERLRREKVEDPEGGLYETRIGT